MSAHSPKKSRSASASPRNSVKTSLVVDVDLHARIGVCASFAGQDRNAFIVSVLNEATRGVVIIDRRKNAGKAIVSSDVESAA